MPTVSLRKEIVTCILSSTWVIINFAIFAHPINLKSFHDVLWFFLSKNVCVSGNNFLSCTFWLENFKCGASFRARSSSEEGFEVRRLRHLGANSSPAGWAKLCCVCRRIHGLQPRDKAAMWVVCWWSIQYNFFSKNVHENSSHRREMLLFWPPIWQI